MKAEATVSLVSIPALMLGYPYIQVQYRPIGKSFVAKIPLVKVILKAVKVVEVLLVATRIKKFLLRHMVPIL